jgi:GDP-D-mannose dehydratase
VEVDQSRFRQADKLVQKGDITKLRQLLSWQPEVPLRTGLRQLLEYEHLLPGQ